MTNVNTGKTEGLSCDISVILPAYNEANRLPATLEAIFLYTASQPLSFEIIVVDDGSTDSTCEVVEDYAKDREDLRLLKLEKNCGKGAAVKRGMLAAKGELVIYNDADGSTPIEEIEKLIKAIKGGADIAIGSRAIQGEETKVDALWYRKVIGRVFNGLVNFLILPQIADTQCGFKMFRCEVVGELFSKMTTDGFSFDVEILYLARLKDYKIVEVPINWHDVPGSKVDIIWDSMRMLRDILKFRFRRLLGRYGGS